MTGVERWEARGLAMRRSPVLASSLVGITVAIFSPLAFIFLNFAWGQAGFSFAPSAAAMRGWAPTLVSLCVLWFVTTPERRFRIAIAVFAASGLASVCYFAPSLKGAWLLIEIARAALLGIFLPFAFFERCDWRRMPGERTFLFSFYFTLTAIAHGVLCGLVTASLFGWVSGSWAPTAGVWSGGLLNSFAAGYAGGVAALITRCILFFETPSEVRPNSIIYSITKPFAKLWFKLLRFDLKR